MKDFVILFCSPRRDIRSLGEMVKMEMGPVAGGIALIGALGIMIIILAGYFVYQGTIGTLGGVNTIWPLFGISNQMLAGIALLLATTILIKLKRERYV